MHQIVISGIRLKDLGFPLQGVFPGILDRHQIELVARVYAYKHHSAMIKGIAEHHHIVDLAKGDVYLRYSSALRGHDQQSGSLLLREGHDHEIAVLALDIMEIPAAPLLVVFHTGFVPKLVAVKG
ncbi:hypothetical protein DSECCO2_634180 [anaerobic digester metagenome]